MSGLSGTLTPGMIPCDGCNQIFGTTELVYVQDYGHECRYCAGCAEVYQDFVAGCQAEEQRRQKEFDFWMLDMRARMSLLRMPMDFGPIKRRQPQLVLG